MKTRWAVGLIAVAYVALPIGADEPPARPDRQQAVAQKLRQLEAAGRHVVNPAAFLSKEKRASALKVASEFAQKVAGADDKKYVRALQGFYRTAVATELDLNEDELTSPHEDRTFVRPPAAQPWTEMTGRMRDAGSDALPHPARSIVDHPNYAKNLRKLLALAGQVDDLNPAGPSLRIVGGVEETENKFPDCVCVGGSGGYCCTGTLVGKNVVVTAGHCYPCIRFGTKVFVGLDINKPGKEYTGRAVRHPQYGQGGKHNDLCVIVLDQDVEGVAARPVAASGEIDGAFFTRAVGYGTTDFGGTMGFGLRRYVDLPVVAALCQGEMEPTHYGCDMGFELVAGVVGLNKDTCKGDSGGPVYVLVGGDWKLCGATSRATDEAPRVCGDGGIYVRVDKYFDWIKSVEGGRW